MAYFGCKAITILIAIFREILQQICKYTCCEYCIISINSSSLCDCDMPDKIFISSPCQEGCDKVQISPDGLNLDQIYSIQDICDKLY